MNQDVNNDGSIDTQINAPNATINNFNSKSRWQQKFDRLRQQVASDERYATFIDDFNNYNTIQDGIGLEAKLKDSGFSNSELIRAMARKEKYSMRVVMGEMFLAQQEIDVEIFAIIDNNFYTFIYPRILQDCHKEEILILLNQNIIQPILDIINKEGENDVFLNYNANDIYGMVYFLTGKCHLNWKNYDNI